MKNKRIIEKIISVTLAFCLVFSFSPASAFAQIEAENPQSDELEATQEEQHEVEAGAEAEAEAAPEAPEVAPEAAGVLAPEVVEPSESATAPSEETVSLSFSTTYISMENNPTMSVDGVTYLLESVDGKPTLKLPKSLAATSDIKLATYSAYNKPFLLDADYDYANSMYPVSLHVWEIANVGTAAKPKLKATHLSGLTDVLKYAGCSVRTLEPQGVRLVTSIPESTRSNLIDGDVSGYTLLETGTIVQWTSQVDNASLTWDSTTMRGKAYDRAASRDAVYRNENGVIKYSNVLTGFSDEQCKPLLSLRSYMLLQKDGKNYYLYGGTVTRSIGYIASQNANEFGKGTLGYRFIWKAIHAAYGDALDESLNYVDWDIREHVGNFYQYDDQENSTSLDWGCESVALTDLIIGFGYDLDMDYLYDTYLTHSTWDFVHAYAGDARAKTGIGMVCPPGITDCANRFLVAQGARERAYNMTGNSLDQLLEYIDLGYPVLCWITTKLDDPLLTNLVQEGYRAYGNVHCVCVWGYDETHVKLSDSIFGWVWRDRDTFADIYDKCGRMSVVVL